MSEDMNHDINTALATTLGRMSDLDHDAIIRRICICWNCANNEDSWDYSCGVVDADINEQEEVAARLLAEKRGAQIYVLERQGPYLPPRLIAPLMFVAEILLPHIVRKELVLWDDEDVIERLKHGDGDATIEATLEKRRVMTWDPLQVEEAIEHLFDGYELELLNRGVAVIKGLDLDGEDWSEESVREVARRDDETDDRKIRILRAMLISAHDPGLKAKRGPFPEAQDRAFNQFRVALKGWAEELADCYEVHGVNKEKAQEKAQEEAQELYEQAEALYEREKQDWDYT